MMETITLTTADNPNNQTLHVAAAGGLDDHQHQHSPVDEEQMMNLTDMADLSQEMQEGLVAIPKEVILISLVSQEQALYNPKHENYRNTQRKDIKWMEIAENVGWTEMQCKAKWKAMRDQYCRELKRSKFNVKANVKWKYFKELDFLRPYALARNYRPRNPMPANNNNTNSNNNNNAFNCTATVPTSNDINNSHHHQTEDNSTKFTTTIKIENTPTANFATCDFSSVKTDNSNNLAEDHLSTVLQQQTDDNNWTYITGSSTSSTNNSRLDNHSLTDTTHLLTTHHHHHHHQQHQHQQQTDEALYNALVDCVGQIQQQQQQQQQQHQHQQHQLCHQPTTGVQHQQTPQQQQQQTSNANTTNDEEDDDPIHTFLNIESYFEKELIGLIQHEDVLYNSFHPNYRNVKLKLEVWDEIARKLKKTVKQCRLKWKALRDQFIREHKRLKNRENVESLPRWKHYDALSFLQKFIKHKAGDFDSKTLMQIPKTEIDVDMDDDDDHMNISGSSPLRSPLDNIKCEISQSQLQIPDLDTVTHNQSMHQQHQQQSDHGDSLCVTSGSVGGYDDMDIDNYIIGDSGSVVDEHNEHDDQEQDTGDEHKSQHNFSVYSNHNANDVVSNSGGLDPATQQTFRESASPQTLQSSAGNEQHHPHQVQQAQHINMPSLDLSDNSHLLNSDSLKSSTAGNQTSFHTATLTSGPNVSLAAGLDICAAVASLPASLPATSEASTNTPQTPAASCSGINNSSSSSNSNNNSNFVTCEDDEVGVFFKAVAMKIRNAKLPPVAFTDLQIDILKVINGSLRNN